MSIRVIARLTRGEVFSASWKNMLAEYTKWIFQYLMIWKWTKLNVQFEGEVIGGWGYFCWSENCTIESSSYILFEFHTAWLIQNTNEIWKGKLYASNSINDMTLLCIRTTFVAVIKSFKNSIARPYFDAIVYNYTHNIEVIRGEIIWNVNIIEGILRTLWWWNRVESDRAWDRVFLFEGILIYE